ncbi:tetraspanin-2-like [Lolium rigidum]|uniref:tetraspanin-2-like n=1 Tax=Lolium rigidum TaxID=89674 RepID=UPI001F5D13DF|nr:tetraspanin-2-like [Lolium rigidum]
MAVRKSSMFTACVALMAVCAVLVIASGVWFGVAQEAECAQRARWPVAILGGCILLATLAGFAGAYSDHGRARYLLRFYFIAIPVLIVILVVFLVFAAVVTGGSGAYPLIGRAYDEYRLDGFSMWLRGYVSGDPGRWEEIRSCLAGSDTCKKLARQASFVTADEFYKSSLTPLQSGCCKPPSECGFRYVGPTVWTNPTSAPDHDCGLWSNNPGQLCYECESCRAGLLATLRSQWHKVNIALVVATVSLIFLYVAGFIAYKKARK